MDTPKNCGLLIVDIQGKLAELVENSNVMLSNAEKLIKGCQTLSIETLLLEQNPKGLGKTHPRIERHLSNVEPLVKFNFNALAEQHILAAIESTGVSHWLVIGIEAHICVYQTALGLLSHGFEVEIIQDCIASRKVENAELALTNLRQRGAYISSVEMFLYQQLETSESPHFKAILEVIR